jgi:hypothetical protein
VPGEKEGRAHIGVHEAVVILRASLHQVLVVPGARVVN